MTRTLMAVLLGAVLLSSACGDATDVTRTRAAPTAAALTHAQYQDALIAILDGEDNRAATRLFFDTAAHPYARAQCKTKVGDFHTRLGSILRQVEALKPPADAEQAQREFLEAARESVRLVGVAVEDVGKGQLACGDPLNSRIYGMPSTERAQEAIASFEQRGYVVFGD